MTFPQYTSSTSGDIAASTPHQYYKEGQNIFVREAPLASMANVLLGSSNGVYWTVSDGGASYGFVGEGEQINPNAEFAVDNVLSANLNRGIVRTAFALTETQLAQVRTLNPAITSSHLKERLKNAWTGSYSATLNGLEQQFLVGQGTAVSIATSVTVSGIFGLTYLLNQSQTSGSYAGVNLSTHPKFKLNFHDCGGGALTNVLADLGFTTVLEQAGSIFDGNYFILTTPKGEAQWKKIGDTMVSGGSGTRFNADEKEASYLLGARRPPDARQARVHYNGIPVIPSSAMFQAGLDGYSVMMSTRDFVVDTLPYDDLNMATFEGGENMVEKFARVTREIGLPLFYRAYANLGGTYSAYATLELQCAFMAPNRMFLWFNHATS